MYNEAKEIETIMNSLIKTSIAGIIIGALIAAGIFYLVKPEPEPVESLQQALFAWGGTQIKGRWDDQTVQNKLEDTHLFPLNVSEANSANWIENGQCVKGIGRYFSNDDMPNLLVYNNLGDLIGIYLYSHEPMSNPWVKSEPLVIPNNVTIIKDTHWALPLYLQNPANACGL